jgi:glutamate carboxypeptidase
MPTGMPAQVQQRAHDSLPALTDDLCRLVEWETPSHDVGFLRKGLDGIRAWMVERLGPPGEEHRHDGGEYGDVLEMHYPGGPKTVLALCHYDTVWPVGTLAEWPFAVTDGIATGPGCFDMKAGLVQAVWALRLLRELGAEPPTVCFVLNGDEEIGSHAARPHIERLSAGAAFTLVPEPSLDGKAKTERKGMGLFDITAHGVESHAGLNPEAGASAVHALSEVVLALRELAAPEHGTTINVGVISGGTGRNVVAGKAVCQVDVRVREPEEMSRIDDALSSLRASDERVRLSVDGEWNRPPMTLNAASADLLERARTVGADLGFHLDHTAVGGASDANFVSALGRPVLDGLGAVGGGAHARDEHVRLDMTPRQIALIAGLLLDA